TFGVLEVSDIIFDRGAVTAKAVLNWPRQVATIQSVADIVTNILFHRENHLQNDTLLFTKLSFGANRETAVTFVDSTPLVFNLVPFIESATNYVYTTGQKLELTNIQTKLTNTGVRCAITGTKLPKDLPFRSMPGAGGIARVMWAPTGTIEQYIVDVDFTEIYFVPGEVFWFNLDVTVHGTDLVPAFHEILPNFLEWKPYLKGVLLGHVTLTQGPPRDPNSIALRTFDQVTVVAPDLYFYSPLLVEPSLMNIFKGQLGLNIPIYFANPGPLHVELGELGVRVYDQSDQIAIVKIPINTKNVLEGGNTQKANVIPLSVQWTGNVLLI
ncbi:hypothetical protein HDU76_012216, partial [Blyttiomyces sp. JEL0837]